MHAFTLATMFLQGTPEGIPEWSTPNSQKNQVRNSGHFTHNRCYLVDVAKVVRHSLLMISAKKKNGGPTLGSTRVHL